MRAPDADVDADDLREFCLDNLAEYKHPREVEFVDQLPRTTTGKVKKYQLRDREATDARDDESPVPDASADDADEPTEAPAPGDDAADDGVDAAGGEPADGEGDDEQEDAEGDAGPEDAEAATESPPEAAAEGGSVAGDGMELRDLDGVSESRAATLRDAGFESVEALRAASPEDLAEVEGFGDALATRIKEQVDGAD